LTEKIQAGLPERPREASTGDREEVHDTMSEASVRIILVGANGRMGRLIDACAADDRAVEVVARLDRENLQEFTAQSASRGAAAETRGQVVIDFSSDEGARLAARLATTLGAALLTGTTGLSEATVRVLDEASEKISVLPCSNTSLGVVVLRRLVAEAARLLGPGYDLDIVESHHRRKLDAPSGTALSLAASIAETGRNVPPERMHSLRGGDVVGMHEVVFAGPGETIRLEHRAERRELFALGALRAAKWLAGRPAGRYRIEDTLDGPGRG
jgi:4-hydroxy-tetrahydrodipicolinate reductase